MLNTVHTYTYHSLYMWNELEFEDLNHATEPRKHWWVQEVNALNVAPALLFHTVNMLADYCLYDEFITWHYTTLASQTHDGVNNKHGYHLTDLKNIILQYIASGMHKLQASEALLALADM